MPDEPSFPILLFFAGPEDMKHGWMNILEEISHGISSFEEAEALLVGLFPKGGFELYEEFERLRGPIGEPPDAWEAAELCLEVWLEHISFKNNHPLTFEDKKRKLSERIAKLPGSLSHLRGQWKRILQSQYNSP